MTYIYRSYLGSLCLAYVISVIALLLTLIHFLLRRCLRTFVIYGHLPLPFTAQGSLFLAGGFMWRTFVVSALDIQNSWIDIMRQKTKRMPPFLTLKFGREDGAGLYIAPFPSQNWEEQQSDAKDMSIIVSGFKHNVEVASSYPERE